MDVGDVSAVQSRLGAAASKLRPTRSGAGSACLPRRVVHELGMYPGIAIGPSTTLVDLYNLLGEGCILPGAHQGGPQHGNKYSKNYYPTSYFALFQGLGHLQAYWGPLLGVVLLLEESYPLTTVILPERFSR